MTEWIVDIRGGICHQCDTEYQRLAGHWARSQTCSYRDLADSHHETIRGILLGDGNLDAPNGGAPALRVASMRRRHVEWLHDHLGWLSRGITRDTGGTYRLRTLSHPTLDRYWTWIDGPPAEGWELTRPIARIWYACDGGLEWPGDSDRPRATWTITDDGKREACAQKLRDQGHGVMVWDRRVALSFDETEAFLDWLGEVMPDSEYKWAVDRDVYDRHREKICNGTSVGSN